jgi:hypothetical protein
MLFFIHLESWRVCLAGVTRHPDQEWMEQMARNVTMEDSGFLIKTRYLLHEERNHQGKDNVLLFPLPTQAVCGEQEKVRCRERLGGLLKYYEREAA